MLRFIVMTVVSEISLMLIAAGFDPRGMAFAGGFILVFATLPVVLLIAVLSGAEKVLGVPTLFIGAVIGLLPTAAMFIILPEMMDVEVSLDAYVFAVCFAGWFWGLAWCLTAPRERTWYS